MGNFAKIIDGVVTDVIVADQSFINGLSDSTDWVENTSSVAGIGYNYDASTTTFYPPQPYNSWILNTETYTWGAPIAYPTDDKNYIWDEDNQNWVESPIIA